MDPTKSGRRGGFYTHQYYYHFTQYRMMANVRTMIMAMLADSAARVKKIGFIKTWAEKGEEGKAARTAQIIVTAQRLYNRMVRMFTFSHDNKDGLGFARFLENFTIMKKMGMELDHMVQVVLEYENTDPSGRLYGRRRSGRGLKDIDEETNDNEHEDE